MTTEEATKTFGLMMMARSMGNSWAQIAHHNGYPSPKAAKKAAREAAKITQQLLLSTKEIE